MRLLKKYIRKAEILFCRMLFIVLPDWESLNLILWECECGGLLLATHMSNRGKDFICLRCLTLWTKPTYGKFYRRKDYGKKGVH